MVARWRLGEELARLRKAAGLGYVAVGEQLGVSESMVRKIEAGDRRVRKSDVIAFLELVELQNDTDLRAWLLELQRQGEQRGWWHSHGSLLERFQVFLSLEGSATGIRVFEPTMISGLLQTDDYARAVSQRDRRTGKLTAEGVEREVQIKIERQRAVFDAESPPELSIILDEAALRRVIGGVEVMQAQLAHLVEVAELAHVRLQVIPYDQGAHPGMYGSLMIIDFEEALHSPIVCVDSHGGVVYMEKVDDVERCNLVYNELMAIALSPRDSVRLISEIARELR